MIVEEEYSSFN